VTDAPLEAQFAADGPVDLGLSMAPLRHGPSDPTIRLARDGIWLARTTPAGPATLRVWTEPLEATIHAQAWGPGAALTIAAAPGLAGLLDDPSALVPRHPLIRELQRRFSGLRLPRTGQLLPSLVAAIMEQKVTAEQAHRSFAALVRRLGEPAPGPTDLLVPPSAVALAALPYFEFHPMGVERRRADLMGRVGRAAARIEALAFIPSEEAYTQLLLIPGIGPWTAAETTSRAFGDPDAVSLGDAHLPDLVAWALVHEARADDALMLDLLEPYRGQRGRVVRLLKVAGIRPPRFGPRFSPRRIDRI
jgi:3-methyladenine DNA glycosylase/8-oxoguanine DNA glycosylase